MDRSRHYRTIGMERLTDPMYAVCGTLIFILTRTSDARPICNSRPIVMRVESKRCERTKFTLQCFEMVQVNMFKICPRGKYRVAMRAEYDCLSRKTMPQSFNFRKHTVLSIGKRFARRVIQLGRMRKVCMPFSRITSFHNGQRNILPARIVPLPQREQNAARRGWKMCHKNSRCFA